MSEHARRWVGMLPHLPTLYFGQGREYAMKAARAHQDTWRSPQYSRTTLHSSCVRHTAMQPATYFFEPATRLTLFQNLNYPFSAQFVSYCGNIFLFSRFPVIAPPNLIRRTLSNIALSGRLFTADSYTNVTGWLHTSRSICFRKIR